jgi:hypothetical protein
MHTIAIRLNPAQLANPDTDLRYELPDLIIERSGGVLEDDGWGYEGDPPFLVVFLRTTDLQAGLGFVLDAVNNVRVMGNDLRVGCLVATRSNASDEVAGTYLGYEVAFPPGGMEPFAPWAN